MLFLRYLQQADQAVRNGGTSAGLCGREIRSKKVGIIGCGQIGFMTAKLFQAFGAEVYAYARHEREEVKAAGIAYKPLDDLLRECDIISLHTPNNKETRGMISAEKIALMKKSAIFINCARGPIVDSKALAQALNEGRIAGAAVDVFDCEPPIPAEEPLDDLLRECDIISLHTPNNKETRGMISAEKIALMKKSAIFINCARGPIVDSKALAQALNEGRIAGAAVDVFDCEPPIPAEEPLLHAKNTLLTPHVAFLSEEAMVRRTKIEFSNVYAYLDGKPENVCAL